MALATRDDFPHFFLSPFVESNPLWGRRRLLVEFQAMLLMANRFGGHRARNPRAGQHHSTQRSKSAMGFGLPTREISLILVGRHTSMKLSRMICPAWLLIGLVVLGGAHAQTSGPHLQGSALLKSDLMFVGAHPDDETGVASTLAYHARGLGMVVACVYATRGEGGGNMVGTHSGPALGALREVELRDCLNELGVRHLYFLDELDWAYTESLQATLTKWGREDVLEKLVRAYRLFRPEVILAMNPAPNPGQHGHHQAAGLLAIEAFNAAADPSRFPQHISHEGLDVWRAKRLFFGGVGPSAITLPTDKPMANGLLPGDIAGSALSRHRSQGFGGFVNSPWLRRPQSFLLIQSSSAPIPPSASDLFAGLGEGAPRTPHASTGASAPATALSLAFVPRPAIVRYRDWMESQALGHIATSYPVDLPCVVGRTNEIRLELSNPTSEKAVGPVRVIPPTNWKVAPETIEVEIDAGATRQVVIVVTPPAGARRDEELVAAFGGLQAKCVLHPVPIAHISRLRVGERSDPSSASLKSIPIDPTLLVQGKVEGAADSSGSFSVAMAVEALYVRVEVKDDHVVSNVEPNDIKGHWRSDSVEICIDPVGGAEDTMGAFKLGIFPFDTTGKVRGARDADANPGPIERSAPGTKIRSQRTVDGYLVEATIPLEIVGLGRPEKGREIGFNVIIYDGDKTDAAPGENINKSRLAWSPRPGVQGRPEDWGRLIFD